MPLSSHGILQCLYHNSEVNGFENVVTLALKLSATSNTHTHTHTQDSIVCCVERGPSGKAAWKPEKADLSRQALTVYKMPVDRQ